MKAVARISLKGLMASKNLHSIFEVLQDDSKEPQILLVGGCVRNALLEREISDIDLATRHTPQEAMRKLKKAGIKVVPTGFEHGTITAVIKEEHFQITTLRQDIETDGRHAKVAYTDDWISDARRRDFTFNTLLADRKGRVFDPLERGISDLKRGKVIFVGDPKTRIHEDYLRILRFFRFHAAYGKAKPDQKALGACSAASHNLKSISKERVTEEFFKILSASDPGPILALMKENKILPDIIQLKSELSFFKTLKKYTKCDLLVLKLLILSNFSNSDTLRIEKNLCLTKKQKNQIDKTLFYLKTFKIVTDHSLKILLYRADRDIACFVLLARLLLRGETQTKISQWIGKLDKLDRPVLPLRGQDLIDRGMQPGPGIKKALEKFERSWIKSGFILKP